MRTLSPTSLPLVFARFCGSAFIHLIKFTHPNLPAPLYYCDDNVDVTSTADGGSQNYSWKPITVSIPVEDMTTGATASLTIDNTQLDMSTMVGLCNGDPPVCTIWIINRSEPNTVVAGPFPMEIRQADLDENQLVVTLEYEEAGDENIPGDQQTPGTTPGEFSASWYSQVDD